MLIRSAKILNIAGFSVNKFSKKNILFKFLSIWAKFVYLCIDQSTDETSENILDAMAFCRTLSNGDDNPEQALRQRAD